MSLIKDQYLLEYQEKFEAFFDQFKVEADFKVSKFLSDNARESLSLLFDKLNNSFRSEMGYGNNSPYYLFENITNSYLGRVRSPETYKGISDLLNKNVVFSDVKDGRARVKSTHYEYPISITPEQIQTFYNWIEKNRSQLEKFQEDYLKYSKYYKDYEYWDKVSQSKKREFQNYESHLKNWIQRYKDLGVEIEAYETMLEKAKQAAQSQIKQDEKIQKQDVPVKIDQAAQSQIKQDVPVQVDQAPQITQEITQTLEPSKKSNLMPLIALGAAAFLLLRGDS
jgi:DNA-binding transcriptional MerR regulator